MQSRATRARTRRARNFHGACARPEHFRAAGRASAPAMLHATPMNLTLRPKLSGFALAVLIPALSPLLSACESSDDGGAANIGVVGDLTSQPTVLVDDDTGTQVRVNLRLRHMGGPDAETFAVEHAHFLVDGEEVAEIPLIVDPEYTQFTGLSNGEEVTLGLVGDMSQSGPDLDLCADPNNDAAASEARVALDLEFVITPGANDAATELVFESSAVSLTCSISG